MKTFIIAFILIGLLALAIIYVFSDLYTAIKDLVKKHNPELDEEPTHHWMTGIMLWGYKTTAQNGQIVGFDADYDTMVALNGEIVPMYKYVEAYSEDMSLPEPFQVNRDNEVVHPIKYNKKYLLN